MSFLHKIAYKVAAICSALAAGIVFVLIFNGFPGFPESLSNITNPLRSLAFSSALPTPSALQAPIQDITWHNCTASESAIFEEKLPAHIILECGFLDTPLSEQQNPATPHAHSNISLALMRARTVQTPLTAAPLVMVNSTMGSALQLLTTWAAKNSNSSLIASHPIVAMDRRGTGDSSNINCFPLSAAQQLVNQGVAGNSIDQRINSIIKASSTAAANCQASLNGLANNYSTYAAAGDLEKLRIRWGVDSLGLIGVGDGSSLALSYAAQYPNRIGRLILDTPKAYPAASKENEQKAQATEETLDSFASMCQREHCVLGSNPHQKLATLIQQGADGKFANITDGTIVSTLRTIMALGPGSAKTSVHEIAQALISLQQGKPQKFQNLTSWAIADNITGGEFIARCTDKTDQQTPAGAKSLASIWSRKYPLSGTISALESLSCAGWSATVPIAPLKNLPVPVVIVEGENDPLTGTLAADTLKQQFATVGIKSRTITWTGFGHSALAHSDCGGSELLQYISTGKEPVEIVCPA